MNKEDPRSVLQQAVVSAKLGRRLMARMQLEQVVATEPELADAWLWLGWTADSPEQSIRFLESALQCQPEHPIASRLLEVARQMSQFEPPLPAMPAAEQPAVDANVTAAESYAEFVVPVAEACVDDEEWIEAAVLVDEGADEFDVPGLQQDDNLPGPPPAAERTVLIVDDSSTVRMLVKMSLEARGLDVQTAKDATEAMALLQEMIPRLILVDDNMPEMDGYKFCKWIKGHEHLRGVPLVMMSDHEGMFDKLRGKLVGCNESLSKPFELADLLKCVESHAVGVAANIE